MIRSPGSNDPIASWMSVFLVVVSSDVVNLSRNDVVVVFREGFALFADRVVVVVNEER